ncbi:sulfotransferase [Pseudidiomarina sp. 1ASP75-14]|uniref:tetratricopeptide repeat-containing sulfotransferase family protein n=1 Tax=Pseudidiomarina terrestris TaxID=2820060 RepID=UPI00264D3CDC|nr:MULTISPECIES: tetratricopeptide repeat-containing sulfotransferase family protein [unclassified Pseudidiomarina]MDN7126858.1 sulfotransferase [Pseudidiomarina sp. 1APR75-33.1]MDN7136707.1 sulfotransferase [Pseudidiomarina sp. 1ASP75-14]
MNDQSEVPSVQQLGQYLNALLKGGQQQAARDYIDAQVQRAPDSAAVVHLAAQLHHKTGALRSSLAHLNRAIELMPDQPALHIDKLHLLTSLRERKQLAKALEHAKKLATDNKNYQQQLARFYTQLNRPEQALELLTLLRKAHEEDSVLAFDEALNQWFVGKHKAAEKLANAVCEQKDAPSMAFYVRALLRKQTKTKNHVEQLADRARKDEVADTPIWFALGKEADDLGLHEQAFAAVTSGNALQKKITPYNEAAELDALTQMADVASTWKSQGRANKNAELTPIFVVSMPGSGATLIERYLHAHPQVTSAGEFPDFPQLLGEAISAYLAAHPGATRAQAIAAINYGELGKAYLKQLQDVADGNSYVVDKLPFNFLYCGMLKKALPNAKIIHVERDALDTCWSIYRTLFADRYAFAYDQEELGRYYRHYQAIMSAWQQSLGDELLTVTYEAFVEDTETTEQKILDFCGLQAASAQDDFVKQVPSVTTARGEPLTTRIYQHGIGHSKAYAKQLQALQSALDGEV